MTVPFVYLNGCVLPLSDAHISPMDRGFLYGDGLFETLRTFGGKPCHLREHLDRLRTAGDRIALNARLDAGDVAAVLDDLRDRNHLHEMVVRITVTRGPHRGSLSLDSSDRTVFIHVAELKLPSPELYARGVALSLIPLSFAIGHRPLPVKATSYLTNLVALSAARAEDCYDVLFTTPRGEILEGACTNVFFVKGDTLITPPVQAGILPGITRRLILDLAASLHIPLSVRPAFRDLVVTCREAFLTNSIIGVVPVKRIAGVDIPVNPEGPTARISRSYQSHVAENPNPRQ